jgi:hypothetical protein
MITDHGISPIPGEPNDRINNFSSTTKKLIEDVPEGSPHPHSDFEFGYEKPSPSRGDSHRHIRFAEVEEKTLSPETASRQAMRKASQYPLEDED